MRTFELEIVTPVMCLPPRSVTFLDVPAESGRLSVLGGHQPLVCTVAPGRVVIEDAAGRRERWKVGKGALTVTPGRATLLVRHASREAADGQGGAGHDAT